MLRNNADVRRCSYFELGLPVIEHNQTPKQSNIIEQSKVEHCIQQSNIKPVSLRSNNLCIGFNFKHEYAKSQRENPPWGKR